MGFWFVSSLLESSNFGDVENINNGYVFSNVEGIPGLEVGTEVEYCIGTRNTSSNHNMVAENVRPLPPGTIKLEGIVEEDSPVINGVVKRSLRSLNPDQKEYAGLIQELGE